MSGNAPSSPRKTAALALRVRLLQAVRSFFDRRDFLEVETPLLTPAPAPEVHIDAITSEGGYLQTSPELCMKRLLAAGHARIYQICRCFRRGERGDLHLPEFTMLEWYRLHADYQDLMRDCEDLLGHVVRELGLGTSLTYQGRSLDLTPPWERLSVEAVFARHGRRPLEEALAAGLFDEILAADIEPHLGHPGPSFLLDYPASMASLARLKSGDQRWAERCELYLAGIELANGFSELTDPSEQRRRFEAEQRLRQRLGKTVYPWPDKFMQDLTALDGARAAGIALGLDRLVMLFADKPRIDDVVAFTPEEL